MCLGFAYFSTSNTASAATGINHQINFQGKLVNPTGTNVTDGSYSIVFSIYTVAAAGANIWTETQTVTVTNGVFQVNLGSVTALPGSIDFNTDNIYLGIKVGADAEMTPRVQFTAVPQSFNSEKLGGLDKTGFVQNTTTQQATSNFNISGAGVVGTSLTTPLLQSAAATALNITGNAASTWSTSAGNITLQAGGGTISLGSTTTLSSTGALTITGGTTLALTSTGANAISLDSGTTGAVNIGVSANAKTVIIGNITGTTGVVVDCGTNGCSFGASATAHLTTLGSINSTSTTTLQSGSGGVNIGTGGIANTIQIGSTTGAVAQNINIGTNSTASSTNNVVIGSTIAGTTTIQNVGTISLNAGIIVGTATVQNLFNTVATSLNIGGDATTLSVGAAAGTTTVNGNLTVAANKNLSLANGTGTITQGYVSAVTGNAQTSTVTNSNASATVATVAARNIALIGAANANANANILNGINFNNVTTLANNSFTGLNFGTGYNSLLTYNGTSLIAGTGLLQNAALDPAISYTNLQKVGALSVGSLAAGFTTVAATVGGTGQSSYVIGDLLFASSTTALSRLADVATGSCFISGGVGVAPGWGTCGAGVTLQTTYSAGIGGTTPSIKLDATRGELSIQDADTTIAGNLLSVRASNGAGLGATLFAVTSMGVTTFKNTTDSTSAFVVRDSGNFPVLNVDTSNAYVGIGTIAPASILHLKAPATAAYLTVEGAGDINNYATLELRNTTGDSKWQFSNKSFAGVTKSFEFNHYNGTSWITPFSITDTGNVGVNMVNATANLQVAGATLLKGTSSTTFQVQNAAGATALNVSTSTLANLVANPSAEASANGWVVKGTGTVALDDNQSLYGKRSVKIVTGAVANNGGAYSVPLKASTQYSLSVWLRKDAGSTATINIGRQDNAIDVDCLAAQTVDTTWRQFTCTFTTGATINSTSNLYIKQTDTVTDNLYVDGLALIAGATAQAYDAGGANLQVEALTSNIAFNSTNTGELQPWQLGTNALPAVRSGSSSVVANGYVYITGGTNAAFAGQSTVYYAKLNADGSTGAWTTNTFALPDILNNHSSVVANGYIYIIGGNNPGGRTATVYYAKLNADGSTSAWTTNATALPVGRSGHTSIVANGYVYAMGGFVGGAAGDSTVYYAKLNADGSVGTWITNTNPLPAGRYGHTNISANGYVYVMGGYSTGVQNTVYYAKLNADGSVGTWITNTNPLPFLRQSSTSVVANGYAYVIGGINTTIAQTSLAYAKLNADGSTGAWTTNTNALPVARQGHSSVIANGYVYVMGGTDTVVQSTVYYASTARIQLGGSLDLVGLSSANLTEGGGVGGSLTAGNTFVAGWLQVTDQANFLNSVSIDKELAVRGSALFQNTTNSTAALQVQTAAAVPVLTVDTTKSQLVVRGNAAGDAAVLGAELFTTAYSFPVSAGWTAISGTGAAATATHTVGGGVTALSPTPAMTIVAGNTYQVTFTVSGSPTTTEAVMPSIGSTGGGNVYGNTIETQIITATNTGNLAFTPSTNWDGMITAVSIKKLTTAMAVLLTQDSVGAVALEVRTGSAINNNNFIGVSSGGFNTTGYNNAAIGGFALGSNTTGFSNNAIGYLALGSNTTGNNNVAVGDGALNSNTTGYDNAAIGSFALGFNTTGVENVAHGSSALSLNTTGFGNTALGSYSLNSNTTGGGNTALGAYTLGSNTTGSFNSILGYSAGSGITTGTQNLLLGSSAGWNLTTGSNNVLIGQNVVAASATGNNQLQIGVGISGDLSTGTLAVKTTTNSTTALQVQNLSAAPVLTVDTINAQTILTSTSSDAVLGAATVDTAAGTNPFNTSWTATNWTTAANTATHITGNTSPLTSTWLPTIGTTYQVTYTYSACTAANTLGITMGGQSLETTTSCVGTNTKVVTATSTAGLSFTPNSTYVGIVSSVVVKALTTQVGSVLTVKNSSNIATLEVRSSGSTSNLFIGLNAGKNNTSTGTFNTAFGTNALQNNTTGAYNTASGNGALQSNTTGGGNTASGYFALQANTTGTNNTASGVFALQTNTTGTNNTALGYRALNFNGTGTNNTASGNGALYFNGSGTNNTASGYAALQANTTGSNNTASGVFALQANTTGSNNTASGYAALTNLSTLTGNISATVTNVGKAKFTISYTTGLVAGLVITISGTTSYNGSRTIASVDDATHFTITTAYSTADATGFWTTVNTDGNTAEGYQAGYGSSNSYTAVGNSLFGYQTGLALQSGANYNTLMGYSAGSGITTGAQNLLLGYNAGTNLTSGSNNVLIGQGVVAASATGSNQLQIGVGISGDLSTGTLAVKTTTNSTTALQVQNASGVSALTVDTTNLKVSFNASNAANLTAWQTNANSLINTALNHNAVVTGRGYIYSIGGNNGATLSTEVQYAKLNADGSTGAWATTTALPTTLNDNGAVFANGYVYILGGATAVSTFSSAIYYASVNADGTLGAWITNATTLPALRTGLGNSVVFAPNGYIYVLGGDDGVAYNTIWYAKPRVDGSLPAFTVNANTLPAVRRYGAVVASNGYIYYLGGTITTGGSTTVYYGSYSDTTGAVNTFTTSAQPLPLNLYAQGAVALNGSIYVIGGTDGTVRSTIFEASIGANGANSAWATDTNSLPGIRNYFGTATYNGYIYNIRGSDGTSRFNTVYYASLPRLQVAGALDLIGSSTAAGASATSTTGGNLTAGNTLIAGRLEVTGQSTFWQNTSFNDGISVSYNGTGYAMQLQNLSTATSVGAPASSSDGLLINLGTANASRTTGNYFVGFAGGGTVAGKIQGGASAVAYTTTAADYAEYFKTDPAALPIAGELVMIDRSQNQSVLRSAGSTTAPLAGIVSTSPGFVGNGPLCNVDDNDCETNYAKYNSLVALSGQVPAKVNTSNGPIVIGDPITASTVAGEGAKAIGDGYIVGYAMEPLAVGSGTVKVLVRPQYYAVSSANALQAGGNGALANLQISGQLDATNLNVSGNTSLYNLSVTGSVTVTQNLTVTGLVSVGTLVVNGHIITAGDAPTVTVLAATGTNATATIVGNDTSGTITITTGDPANGNLSAPTFGELVKILFNQPFGKAPQVDLTPGDANAADLRWWRATAADSFSLNVKATPTPNTTYTFDYFVRQ